MITLLIYRIIRFLFWFYLGWLTANFFKWCYRQIQEKRQEKLDKIEHEKALKRHLDEQAEEVLKKEFEKDHQQRREHHVDQDQ
jgi:hypothetical protein